MHGYIRREALQDSALWRGPDNIHGYVLDEKNPTDKDKLLLKHQWLDRRFRCEDNNVELTHVQPHYYCVRQVK